MIYERLDRSYKKLHVEILENPQEKNVDEIYNLVKEKKEPVVVSYVIMSYMKNEMTAKYIYTHINQKIEQAELTSQELWDLWAEYYKKCN